MCHKKVLVGIFSIFSRKHKHLDYLHLNSLLRLKNQKLYPFKARGGGGGVNVIFSVFTYVTELLKTNK